jgi:hypothetical protein
LACLLYSIAYLGTHGDLAVLAYESYMAPALGLIGAAIGSPVGAVVGWAGWPLVGSGEDRPRRIQGVAIWRLSATGVASGIAIVLLAAGVLWATAGGRAEAAYLVKVGCAGAFVGWVVALSVGFALSHLAGPRETAEQPKGL